MKKIVLFLVIWQLSCVSADAQNEQNIWAFGSYAGLNFTTISPTTTTNNLAPTDQGCASVCDGSGQLLFYTNGAWVWNRINEILPELTGGLTGITSPIYPTAYPPLMPYTGGWATQSAAIAAVPAHPGSYYVFSLSTTGQLYYSMIDMSLNSGYGGVVTSKKGIGLATGLAEKLTVVKGCNNIWVVVRSKTANEYKAFEVNDTGIVTTPVISNVGLMPASWYRCGVIKFSPDGTKMAASCNDPIPVSGGLELYDFDAMTGKLSNAAILDSSNTKGYYYGACFSPDGTKLYASTSSFGIGSTMYYGKVRQFNLSFVSLPAIIASNTLVYTDVLNKLDNIGDLKRGKDGKIYFSSGKTTLPYMHRIDAPNNTGISCTVVPFAIALSSGVNSQRGLPNDVALLPLLDTVGTQHVVSVCFRDSVILLADTGKRYSWSNNSTTRHIIITHDGNYIVRYINAACQLAIDTYLVHFNRLPAVYTNGFSCSGKGQGFAWCKPATGDNSNFYYTWQNGAGTILRQHWSNAGDTVKGLDTGRYAVRITTQSGCDTTLYTSILPLPIPQVSIIADSMGCVGAPMHYTGVTDAPVWSWQFGDGNTSTTLTPDYYYRQTGTYTVRFMATNIEGCSDTVSKNITIKELDIKLTSDKDLVNMGELVNLHTSANEPYVVLAWEPSDLFTDQSALSQTIQMDTTQTFVVIGKSAYGCIGKASVQVAVTPKVFMPNAFTPNNDGINDRFRPVATGYIFVRYFEIYNRYGQMVYSAQGRDVAGWDGTFNGQLMDIGTYYYHINIETKENKTISLKGDVILLR